MKKFSISVVIPAKNEASSLESLLPKLQDFVPDAEVIVVNDGSTDATSSVLAAAGVIEVLHPYSKGNGAAIKAGARRATGDIIVFMDGDGQHDPSDIPTLLNKIGDGYDLVVGARAKEAQANAWRWAANTVYNRFASWMVGHEVRDLTSGFRAVRADRFKEFLYLLPNGFSYPTTSTMAFFRAGYSVCYIDIDVGKRDGKSHINIVSDGIKFLLIIFKVGTLYSPLKLFFPIATSYFLIGVIYYGYTFFAYGRFTNMSLLLFSAGIIIFLIGLISEQITSLQYRNS